MVSLSIAALDFEEVLRLKTPQNMGLLRIMAQNVPQKQGIFKHDCALKSLQNMGFQRVVAPKAVIAVRVQQNVGFSISWSEACGNV